MESRGQHWRSRRWWTRWWAVTAALALVGGGAAVAIVSGGGSSQSPGHSASGKSKGDAARAAALSAAEIQLASAVSVSPASGTSGVALDSPITVSTTVGAISAVQVTDPSGKAVPGTLAPSGLQWQSASPLSPSTTYKVTATVIRPDGLSAQRVSSFTTLTPTYQVSGTAFPSDGMTVGVGQPIVIKFNYNVRTAAGQQAALSHIKISMSKPVPGGWHWFSMYELHFRPETYWPTGERVNVTANFAGWDAGLGRWGTGTIDSTFSVGDSRVSVANLATHEMTVTLDGKTIATYPISGGRTQYPTMNGTHLVLDRESVVHMVSSTVGIPVKSPNGYDEYVYDDVHISDSGEYVHAAPWSVGAQGSVNVSHGCINVSPANALAFFNFSRIGDIVVVEGGPRPPAYGDHGVMDWSTSWSQWTPATVHQLA